MTTNHNEGPDQRLSPNRRDVLKAVGGTTAGISGLAGVASAGRNDGRLKYNFYGCSQVCVNKKKKVTAVVWTGERFRYACIESSSNRNDPPVRDWENVYCYEVQGEEAIVGICYKGKFIENPNRCAENYPEPERCKDVC